MSPSSILGALFWGVVAGILTSAFLWLSAVLISKAIIPWYQQVVYRGIDLSGRWEQTFEREGAQYRLDTSLQQSAHLLKGTTTKSKSRTDDDYVHAFTVSGSTWDGFVLLNLESSDRSSLSFGTALLKIYETGERLKGYLVYRGRQTDEVELEEAVWKRYR
jgi:hypothetical protein